MNKITRFIIGVVIFLIITLPILPVLGPNVAPMIGALIAYYIANIGSDD